jgi:hypothetical protein
MSYVTTGGREEDAPIRRTYRLTLSGIDSTVYVSDQMPQGVPLSVQSRCGIMTRSNTTIYSAAAKRVMEIRLYGAFSTERAYATDSSGASGYVILGWAVANAGASGEKAAFHIVDAPPFVTACANPGPWRVVMWDPTANAPQEGMVVSRICVALDVRVGACAEEEE